MDIMGRILQSNVIIHPFNSLNFLNIWENIEERKTKLSFVDWSIVTYMKKYGINYIFTFDSDFSKIGYEKVPEL